MTDTIGCQVMMTGIIGKTNLINRLKENEIKNKYYSTIGVELSELNFKLNNDSVII